LRIEAIPVGRIKPAAYNPRVDLQPGMSEYDLLAKGLESFGLVEPLVWNERSGNLVGGHQRFKILIAQGAFEVECSIVDLPDAKEKALNLALNKLGGDFDKPRLDDLLKDFGTDFDIGLAGFTFDDMESLEIDSAMTLADEVMDGLSQKPAHTKGTDGEARIVQLAGPITDADIAQLRADWYGRGVKVAEVANA
jgi:ParB-like chromosome segregation protein Spo0J